MAPSAVRTRTTLVAIAIAIALVLVLALAGCDPGSPGADVFVSGQGHAGPIPRASLGRGYETDGTPCAGCHGMKGEGTRLAPSISRATLGSPRTITHKRSAEDPSPTQVTEGPWTPRQTVEAVRTGKTPEGHFLGGLMPRWRLDSQDASALASYLAKL